LGGAVAHTEVSGVAHYAADDDASCISKLRDLVARLPEQRHLGNGSSNDPATGEALYDLLPADHRMSYDMRALLHALVDGGQLDEFQGALARDDLRRRARIEGVPVGVIANERGLVRAPGREARFGASSMRRRGEGRAAGCGRGASRCFSFGTCPASWSDGSRARGSSAPASSKPWPRRAEDRATVNSHQARATTRWQGFDDFIFS
jgi:acetyl-CoA carboxylase carboxyltransferase component